MAAGHDAIHVTDCDLAGAPDERVLAKAVDEDRVLLSADTDFGEILARSGAPAPSVVLFRRTDAFVVITDERLRIRPLPFR